MAWNQLYVVLFNTGDADPPQQKGAWDGALIHGNASALPLWRLLHWANTPNCSFPAGPFSPPAHCLCPRISFRLGGRLLSEPLSKQWRKEPAIFTLFPGELAFFIFLFQLQAVELRVWCQKAELIALSQRGGPPITKRSPKCFTGDY